MANSVENIYFGYSVAFQIFLYLRIIRLKNEATNVKSVISFKQFELTLYNTTLVVLAYLNHSSSYFSSFFQEFDALLRNGNCKQLTSIFNQLWTSFFPRKWSKIGNFGLSRTLEITNFRQIFGYFWSKNLKKS